MFSPNLTSREKFLLCLALVVSCLGLFYNFALKPLIKEWNWLNYEISEKETTLKRNITYLQQSDSVSKAYQRYANYIKSKELETSDEEEIAALLNEVEKIARAASVQITDIKPKPTREEEFYKKYLLEMDCEATMEEYIKFIYNLQQSTQLIRAERVKLSALGKNSPLLKANMLITKVLLTE